LQLVVAMVNNTPILTVVIPCYNMGEFIDATVDSILAQSFKGFEIIIVDDGSDDPETVTKLDELAARGLAVLRTPNRGVASARNCGVKAARGRYILPLDADDLIEPDYLEKAIRLLEDNSEVAVVSCDAELFGETSGVRRLPDFSSERLLSENLLFASALFRKSDWQAVGGYCTAFRFGWEDWDFWIAMTRRGGKVVRIAEPLLKYRIRSNSRDRSMTLWQKGCMIYLMLLRHFQYYFRSPMSFIRLIVNARPITGIKP
jgi:glycosyltransferase involved in cell wall biosynthesis